MKNIKKIICFLLLCFVVQSVITAEQLTKIAVVDIVKIYKAFFKESKAIRDLEEFKKKYEAELDKIDNQLLELEKKIVEAKKKGDSSEIIKLEEEQTKTESYRNEYYRVKYKEYVKRFDAIKKSQSQDLWLELIGIIEYIALRESFSVVLRIDDPYVVFYTKDVDITDEVVKEIDARRRKNR
ncbi:MAG: OmpH family outer membrane protein [Spirochaetales bacterium]|nr:OmpH family outer membrane protein [Spirochaetales bacterium]